MDYRIQVPKRDLMEINRQYFLGIVALAVLSLLLVVIIFKLNRKLKDNEDKYTTAISANEAKYSAVISTYEAKYSSIINVDKEVAKSQNELDSIRRVVDTVRNDYKDKKAIFDGLLKQAAIYDEDIQLAELGFYKPHFDFGTSELFKDQISKVKNEQKDMVSRKVAIRCHTEWEVSGSKAKGRTKTNRAIKLTARAFNNECDAAIANVRWNNVARMEQRIEKAYHAINKLNESTDINILYHYLTLKLKELRLTYEYANKKQQEKEEQQEIRRQIREEAQFEQELEKALKEEEQYNKLLIKANQEAAKATGNKLGTLNAKIAKLTDELQAAHDKSERAKSMAEQTRTGHVYIISNIGSFGEGVYKIGMTRRLEPLDRVKELGDASVPFIFDVHAMIHSEDAPALESALHKSFNDEREFFKVSLSDIQAKVSEINPDAEFIETAEARDYRESMSIIAQRNELKTVQHYDERYPETI
jgi:hypothetical protein